MDISLKSEDYKILKANKTHSVEEIAQAELSLPEYMPDILRIIKTTAEPKVISCKIIGDRMTVDGACELRMIYTAEDGCIYSFSQTRQFTRHCESTDFENCVDANAQIDVLYVNCRATGTKRAEVKAGLKICFNVYFPEAEKIISVENCEMEKKTSSVEALSSGCRKTRPFSMSDTITLAEPCAFIVGKSANAVLTEVRKISNKIMLRGEAIVQICYVNSENRGLTENVAHSIPINQILEIEGFQEDFEGNVVLRVNAVDIIPKGEQGNFNTSFDVSLNIDAIVTMWEKKSLCLISDAYCVDCDIQLKKQEYVFVDSFEELKDTLVCDNSLVVSGEGVGDVLYCSAEISGIKYGFSGGEITLTGSLDLSLVIRDTANSLTNVSKAFDFSYKKNVDWKSQSVFCEPEICVNTVKCNVRSSNTIDIRAELCISGYAVGESYVECVTEITASDTPVKRRSSSVVVYFPDCENENLWNIARRYNTTVSAIAEENGLSGDTTEKLNVLFIPSP